MEFPEKYDWTRLNRLQLGKYAEYLVKMEFVLWGCDVFTSEVDDHGIDFVVRTWHKLHYDVQVKSFRLVGKNSPYVFMQKRKFEIDPALLLALVQFTPGQPPAIYLVPSSVAGNPNRIFESRDYGEGRKSVPEWGLTLSRTKLSRLSEECRFDLVIRDLVSHF